MKKKLLAMGMALVMGAFALTGCGSSDEGSSTDGWTVAYEFTYEDIASWVPMDTPSEGSGAGSVVDTNDTEGYVTIQAAADGWGGVESDYFEIDLSRDPIILARIYENPDGYNWGMKIVPENPISDHEWGLYIMEDNNLKWNKYAGVDLADALGEDYVSIYGDVMNIKLWIYPTNGPEATVSVSEILVIYTK